MYGGIAYRDDKQCPRCGMEMTQSPRPLFRSFTLDGGRPKASSAEHGTPFAGSG